MKESFLHYLWRYKKIPFQLLQLTNGDKVLIKSCGEYNINESGPDFINGKIEIYGITWVGNIEMHVKSSDWYLHQHDKDRAYDNVVLHVVFVHDKDVYINGQIVPTIELKNILDPNLLHNSTKELFNNNEFPCEPFLHQMDNIYLETMKSRAIVNRLNRKTDSIHLMNKEANPQQVLYTLLARAFGSKVNAQPFEEISKRVPIKILKRENPAFSNVIIKNVSGVFEKEQTNDWLYLQSKYNFEKIQKFQWKYKGLRPASFPEKRIKQFISVVEKFDFETSFTLLNSKKILHYIKELLEINSSEIKITESIKELLIINCFVPFLWWYGNLKMNAEIQEKSLDLLSYLKPEENHLTKKWRKLGIDCRNSFDSQALLEIYNEFCKLKKCHHCDVGNKILKV